ncbi:N-ATPase subunit AtpR [Roseicella frigidaeris]|nr:ATP synthase subunit I [Roseicella frigidaeris]
MSTLLHLLWVLPGLLLGLLHFRGLERNAALYAAGRTGRGLALQALRLAATAGGLVLAALQGAWPLLAVAAGWLLARCLLVRPPPLAAGE